MKGRGRGRRKGPAGRRGQGKGPNIMQVHRLVRADELRARQRAGAKRWAVVLGLDLASKKWQGLEKGKSWYGGLSMSRRQARRNEQAFEEAAGRADA